MNGPDLLRGVLPYHGFMPAPGARAALGPAVTTTAQAAGAQTPATTEADPAAAAGLPSTGAWQELGASLQALSGVVDALRAQLNSMLGDTSGASAVASSVSASIRQRASFEFVTQEGDVVDLTVRTRASFSSSSASAQDATGSATASDTTLITSSRLSVQVHGNLNDKELAAIKDVLGQVETLADKFFSGDVQAAFAASSSLHIDSTQLASMALDFASRLRVRGVAVDSGAPGAAGAVQTPAATAASPAATAALPAQTGSAAAPATAAQAEPAAAPAGAAPTSVQPAVGFLGNVLGQLQSVASIELSMKSKLQLLLLAVIPAPGKADALTTAKPGSADAAGAAAIEKLTVAAPQAA